MADAIVRVNIADSGDGIASEVLPHIFERFHRGTSSAQEGKHGSGLGLAIVKRILQIHGASISVSSRVKEGTTFAFDLPGKTARQPVRRVPAQ